jgi:hypothetical protein
MRWKLLPTMLTRTLCHCFRHCYNTTMPRGTANIVSDAVAKSRIANVYHLARRSRLQQLSEIKEYKLVSALANQLEPSGCSLTANCQVFPISSGWRIRLCRRNGGKSKVRSESKKSCQYESQIAAKKDMFEFRKSFESPKSKK